MVVECERIGSLPVDLVEGAVLDKSCYRSAVQVGKLVPAFYIVVCHGRRWVHVPNPHSIVVIVIYWLADAHAVGFHYSAFGTKVLLPGHHP